ncbi:MAG TPA: hypothetical protein VG965_00360 [Patescibacteria group bacterium]|nr:hypothetical protein [Patescibacteria group bacterium]
MITRSRRWSPINLLHLTLLFLLLAWVVIASFRTISNTMKIFTEERQWVFLTDDQKRGKIYGDVYSMYKKIDGVTKKESNILLWSQDGKTFYILRYLLYPKRVYWLNSGLHPTNYQTEAGKIINSSYMNINSLTDIHKFTSNDYLLIYHGDKLTNSKSFQTVASFKSNKTTSYLYKLL